MHAPLHRERQGRAPPETGTGTPVKRLPTPLPGPDSRPLCVRGHRNMTPYSATRRHIPGQRRTPRWHENSQLAGGFRRVWQVLGSNQRRLSRRFYSPSLLPEVHAADQRGRASRRDSGPPWSAMRPWVPCFGVRAVHGQARTSRRTGAETPRTGPVGAATPTVLRLFGFYLGFQHSYS